MPVYFGNYKRSIRIHPKRGGIINGVRAIGDTLRRPLLGNIVAARKENEIEPFEATFGQNIDRNFMIFKIARLAFRAVTREQLQTFYGKISLDEQF